MSTCLISDTYKTFSGTGEGGILRVGYLDVPVYATGYINAGPTDIPINDDGTFSLSPTWAAQTIPNNARLYIQFPDGNAWGGLVPSVAGPLTIDNLRSAHGWGVVSESAIAAVTVVGPPGLVWRDVWSSATAYVVNDAVSYAGSAWIALRSSLNSAPVPGSLDWSVLAEGGTISNAWRGPWSSGTTYAVHDSVSYQGSSWISLTQNTNSAPSLVSADWNLIAQAGSIGVDGVPGVTWRGAWVSGTSYALNDGVSFGGSSYVCVTPNSDVSFTIGNWNLLAATGLTAGSRTSSLSLVIDNQGAPITTGVKGDLVVPFDCTVTGVSLLADQVGSIVVDVWKSPSFPPTSGNSITASDIPTISSALSSSDTVLTGWTTAFSAGDILRFNVVSASTLTRVTLALTLSVTVNQPGQTTPVTQVTATAPLVASAGTTPNLSLADSGVTAGTFTNATVTVSRSGLITAASTGSAASGSAGINQQNIFTSPQIIQPTDIVTAAVSEALALDHWSSGVVANNFGTSVGLYAQAASGVNTGVTPNVGYQLGAIEGIWTDATAKTSAMRWKTMNAGTVTEWMRLSGTGQLMLRSSDTSRAAGLYVPAITGDSLVTMSVGTALGVPTAIQAKTLSGTGVSAQSVNGVGGAFLSTSQNALFAHVTNDFTGAGAAAQLTVAAMGVTRDLNMNNHNITSAGALLRLQDNPTMGSGVNSAALIAAISGVTTVFSLSQTGAITIGTIAGNQVTGTTGTTGQFLQSTGAGTAMAFANAVSSLELVIPGLLFDLSTSTGGAAGGGGAATDYIVTTAGVLNLALKTQTAGTLLAGPTSGLAATPTFRAIVPGDLAATNSPTAGLLASYGDSGHVTWVSALSNPMTTVGDIIIGSTAGAAIRLGVASPSATRPTQVFGYDGANSAYFTKGILHGSEHGPGGTDEVYALSDFTDNHWVETMTRHIAVSNVAGASGAIYWAFFKARSTFTASNLAFFAGTTAGSSLTGVRLGIYTWGESVTGQLLMKCQTAKDISGSVTASALYHAAIAFQSDGTTAQTTFTFNRGTWYALAVWIAGTVPTIKGNANASQLTNFQLPGLTANSTPVVAAQLTSQTDLVASVNAGTWAGTGNALWLIAY